MITMKNNMKQKLSRYFLFVYTNYIQEDFSDVKPFAQKLLKPVWFVRSVLVWLCSIFCFPFVLLHMYIEKQDEKIKLIFKDIQNYLESNP